MSGIVASQASFRDPSGFVFFKDGALYRQVNKVYQNHYKQFMQSGLYERLAEEGSIVTHEEVEQESAAGDNEQVYKVLRPRLIPFISYPYEWCFSQLKDAALLTLALQRKALSFGMSLKDASAYNVQFLNGKPILMDTLSFEKYEEGKPWVAYRQFCQHFLVPLALMSKMDIGLGKLQGEFLDGIPMDLGSTLLSVRSRFQFGLLTHIHLHAKSQKRLANDKITKSGFLKRPVSRQTILWLINSLERTIQTLCWKPAGTQWADYYQDDSYTPKALAHKQLVVEDYLDKINPKTVWDLGANTGLFSRIASAKGALTIALDNDPAAVERNYLQVKQNQDSNLLPLVIDIVNPSPRRGFANEERSSLSDRGPAEMALALALVHHLAISHNIPLERLMQFLAGLCKFLIIEFISKDDPKIRKMLAYREDIFQEYTPAHFERALQKYFTIRDRAYINDSKRVIYLLERI